MVSNRSPCLEIQQTTTSRMHGRPLFPHMLKNVGYTCFLNSALQAIASPHPLVEALEGIMLTPVLQDHSDDTYCLVLLQLFLPAIARGPIP
jgi:ubiquitin C-terminal hydrolase